MMILFLETSLAGSAFNVFITDDDISEDTESFRVFLILDPFEMQENIIVDPAVTEVCILGM